MSSKKTFVYRFVVQHWFYSVIVFLEICHAERTAKKRASAWPNCFGCQKCSTRSWKGGSVLLFLPSYVNERCLGAFLCDIYNFFKLLF